MLQAPIRQFALDQEFQPAEYRGDSIDLYVNSKCNLLCRTCFLGDDYFAVNREMSLKTAAAIVRWACEAGVSDIAILGGEPALHRDIVPLLTVCRESGLESIRFVTNGSRPFQRLLRTPVTSLVDQIYVSLDGATEQINDGIRGRGTFRQATQTMNMLADLGIPFVITASVTPDSYGEIEELFGLAEDSGCRRLNIHWVSPTGRARDGGLSVDPSQWSTVCARVAAYRPTRPDLRIDCQRAFLPTGEFERNGRAGGSCAVRERSNLQFMPDGTVYACGLLVDRPGLNGYRWTGTELRRTAGPSEISVCNNSGRPGCPVRSGFMPELATADTNFIPICVYERVHNAAD